MRLKRAVRRLSTRRECMGGAGEAGHRQKLGVPEWGELVRDKTEDRTEGATAAHRSLEMEMASHMQSALTGAWGSIGSAEETAEGTAHNGKVGVEGPGIPGAHTGRHRLDVPEWGGAGTG
jgi:hypothetical protein